MAQPPLRPGVGFCLQTDSFGTPPGRWFVNVCKHKLVDLPLAYSGKGVTKDWILTHGIGNLQVPFDLGSFRKLKERADGSRHTTYVVDVVFNPLIVQLFMDDEFCTTMEQYRPWVLNLALNRIEESIGVKLSSQKVKLVKSIRYKDGEDGGPTPREFTDLPGDRDDMGFEEEYVKRPPPPSTESAASEPLIEDVTPGTRKKPAMKKGFLNKKDAAGSLYGENGSKEGVLPENAGDPMGWMPKKLRQNSKIVDCNSPEYQAQEKQRKAAESTNSMNKEWRDSMMEGFDKLQKKQDQNKWEMDLPDGTDAPTKYDVDYSRFDNIVDEADDKASNQPERDWYVDTSGQMRRIQPEATGSQQSGAPAVKKGFLESSKASIYGPEGSAQAKAPEQPTDHEALFRDLEKMMSPEEVAEARAEAKHFADGIKDAKPPSVAVKSSADAQLKAPDFSLTEADDALSLSISVPGLSSMQGVDLDVTERCAALVFPSSAGLRPLKVELPKTVVPKKVKAKFSRKTHQIVVTLPTSLS